MISAPLLPKSRLPDVPQGGTREMFCWLRDFVLHLLLVRRGLQHEVADMFLRRGIGGAQHGEAASLAVDRVLARKEGDLASRHSAPLPHDEADQLQSFECAVTEVQFGIREFTAQVQRVDARLGDLQARKRRQVEWPSRHVVSAGQPAPPRIYVLPGDEVTDRSYLMIHTDIDKLVPGI